MADINPTWESHENRQLALKLANDYSEHNSYSEPDTVVKRAQAYYDFLSGVNSSGQADQVRHP